MIQYLINSTAIWFISLLVFDLFLRRESYHTYNRFYLLSTFLLGLLLPMLQWQSHEILQPILKEPVERMVAAKAAIAHSTVAEAAFNLEWWIATVYLAGAGIACTLLVLDTMKLMEYYSRGTKTKYGDWTVVATGKEHAPFSFRKLLFVNTREQYSDEEWEMLFIHEQQHTCQLHIADLILMQLARIVFWFNPLIYIYNRRLLMVHEYQADSWPSTKPQAYGHFLVEQSLLQSAPILAHSFNRSPIKKRIIMLTRRSTNASKTKMLALIPIAAVSILCFSQNVFSQKFERKGNIVTYNGNKFELSKESLDSIELQDPVSGAVQTKVVKMMPQPIKMNGKKVYSGDGVTPDYIGSNNNIRTAILIRLKSELSKLDGGEYRFDVNNLIVDENGNIVYYENGGVTGVGNRNTSTASPAIDGALQKNIMAAIQRLLDNSKWYRPGVKAGQPVPAFVTGPDLWINFKIENHRVYDQDANNNWVAL